MVNFYIAAFLADLAMGAVLLAIPLLLIYRFAASSLTLGILGAIGSLVYSLGVIVSGRMSDKFNRRNILLCGCVLFVIVYSILPLLKTANQVILAYALGGVSMAMFWPILQSWLSQGLGKHDLVKSLTGFNISWSAGLMVGFLSAGFLFALNPKWPFAVGVISIIAVMAFLHNQPLMPAVKESAAASSTIKTKDDRPANYEFFLYAAWCANFVSWFNLGIMRNLFPKLGTELGFPSYLVGMLIFGIMLAQTAMFFILGRTHKWYYRLAPVILFQFFAFLAMLTLVFSSRVINFAFAMVFLGLSGGLTYFSSIFYSLYGSVDKGKKSGLHEAVIGVGALFGPLAGGIVADRFGIRTPYALAAAVLLTTMIIEIALVRVKWAKSQN